MSEIKIQMTAHGRGTVFLDGKELEDVVGVAFRCGVSKLNTVILKLQPSKVTVTGIVDVTNLASDAREYRNG